MTQLLSLLRIACAAAMVATMASACGGQSFSSGPGGGGGSPSEGGSSKAGTHSSGGGKAHAGSSSFAGTGQAGGSEGGTNAAGTGSGGGVTAGAGGGDPGDERCNAPPVTGMCDALIQAWYHDPTTGLCRPFIYGGCGGNQNRYDSLSACQAACPGGSPNYDACKLPTDCALVGTGCCGVCDGPGITAHDFVAYNKQYAAQVTPCANVDIACGACPPSAPDQGTLKYFVPNCVQAQCVVEDLRTSSVTACSEPQDCQVRSGNGCCPSCAGDQLIGVRSDGSFENLVCGNLRPPCAACLPAPNAIAVCGASGHCEIEYAIAGNAP
jgi:Kunitz/Bovine pancreatic trypsin inhibitor domain